VHDILLYLYVPLIGFLVGALVATTGIGGGVLLLPLQVMVLHVPPIVAVGSDMAFMFFTKLWATLLHWRHGNMEWRLAMWLAGGSIPGALAGVSLLAYMRFRWGNGVNEFLSISIGVLLVILPLFTLLMEQVRARVGETPPLALSSLGRYHKAVLIGLFGGFLVGLTSVGEGSVIILLLFMFYRRPPNVLVATDIFHGAILSGLLTGFHWRIGTIDLHLVVSLMIGSVIGVAFGSKLCHLLPAVWLRRTVLLLLIPAGIKMI
jgi:uncharacterized protein